MKDGNKSGNIRVVAIRDMSAGNAEIGEAWQETKIFNSSGQIIEVLKWALGEPPYTCSRKRITLTVPHEEEI